VAVTALIAVLAFVATVAFWLDRSVGREAAFRDNVAEVLAMDTSQEALAARLMDEAIDAVPLLALVRGAGENAIVTLLDSGAFDESIDRLAVEAHRYVVSGADGPFVADLTDVRDVLVAPIARLSPDLAARIPVDVFEEVVILDSRAFPLLGRMIGWLPWITIVAAAGAVFLAVSLVMAARRRSMAIVAVGAALLLAGGGAVAWSIAGGGIAADRTTDELTRVLIENAAVVAGRSLRSAGTTLALSGVGTIAAGLILFAVSLGRDGRSGKGH